MMMSPSASQQRFYQRIIDWILPIIKSKKDACSIIGISCVQGGGKTTLCNSIVDTLRKDYDLAAVSISLDDVYYTHEQQRTEISTRNNNNPLLEYRGNPGTHDIPLLLSTLHSLQERTTTLVPRYNKAAFNGRGDRHSRDKWTRVDTPVDVILLEGWCLGFIPSNSSVHLNLVPINESLKSYEKDLYPLLDALVVLKCNNLDYIYEWRESAEACLRSSTNSDSGMSPESVRDFVNRFMPVYAQYLPSLYNASSKKRLDITIGKDRLPLV